MLSTPGNTTSTKDTNLSNWRDFPYSQWAFQHVRQLIPTAQIKASGDSSPLPSSHYSSLDEKIFPDLDHKTVPELLAHSHTDSFVVLCNGEIVWRWQADHCDHTLPHIVFSISKSIAAMLAGILVDRKIINVNAKIPFYLPSAKNSAYQDCTVQNVLDMTVALAFEEDYQTIQGDYVHYRRATGWNPVDQTQSNETLEPVLIKLQKANFEHGEIFNYKSPNSDLLGLVIEQASGARFADLLSELIWQPMGAETDGYVTVDRALLARAAGGICISIDDLARFGQLILQGGTMGDKSIIPSAWIEDTLTGGDRTAWQKGGFVNLLPNGKYRNKWYQVGDEQECFLALGIHDQWLYINPTTCVVIAKMSSQPTPLDETLDARILAVLHQISVSASG